MIARSLLTLTILSSAALFLCVSSIYAASDSFTVTQGVNTPDTEPPTTPTNLTATPVTSSQIDLDWDASSDNIGVEGYQVFRDSSQIATTTLTSFSDTGLSASTTYSYTVTAFDVLLNISTPTPAVATTTLPVPVAGTTSPTTTEDGSSTATQLLRIQDLDYETTRDAISITFDTTLYAQATIRWGRTRNYEGGYTTSDSFRRAHETVIDGLNAGTIYEVEIVLVDRALRHEIRKTLTISTEAGPDMTAPTNVHAFAAILKGEHVSLSWRNPTDEDFSHVRILSSDRFYPSHQADGWLVYEGPGISARDERPLAEGQRRYYTIFTYDTAGNVSSGVVTSITRGTYVPPPPEQPDRRDTRATSGETVASPEPDFDFDDLVFTQDGEEHAAVGGEVALDATKATLVSLSYDLVPEHLKTIVVTLTHPEETDRVFSFLLRINPQKTAYEARIGPLDDSGSYPTEVTVFDYATEKLFSVHGSIIARRDALSRTSEVTGLARISRFLGGLSGPAVIFLIGLVLFVLILIWKRKREREESGTFKPRSLR